MLAATVVADAAGVGHPVVAAMLGIGAAGVAGGVVAMAWNVHMRQLQFAEQLAHHHRPVQPAADAAPVHVPNGNGVRGSPPPVVIEGPDTVLIGQQARYRVHPAGAQQVVSWTAGGGSVSQAADPAHPDELLLVADQPGNLVVSVRLRQGLAERRETKSVTAVVSPEAATSAFLPRLFLHDWGLVAVAVLVVGFAGALVALGSLTSADFIALVAPLAALFVVMAAARTGPRAERER
jgi:hypothetical protein